MINKKGQIGQILTSLPVMFLVFIVMLLFVIASAFISTAKNPVDLGEGRVLFTNDLMLQKINDNFVYENIVFYHNGKIKENELRNIIKKILKSENECIILTQGNIEDPLPTITNDVVDDYYFKYEDGKVIESNKGFVTRTFKEYDDAGILVHLYFYDIVHKKRVFLKYYYGECLDE
jgi:hypothetical protein